MFRTENLVVRHEKKNTNFLLYRHLKLRHLMRSFSIRRADTRARSVQKLRIASRLTRQTAAARLNRTTSPSPPLRNFYSLPRSVHINENTTPDYDYFRLTNGKGREDHDQITDTIAENISVVRARQFSSRFFIIRLGYFKLVFN